MPVMTAGAGRSTTFRTMSVLRVVARAAEPITLSEIARRTGLPVATAHRYVHELIEWGSLQRADGAFVLGAEMWRLGMATSRERVLRRTAAPVLESLTARTTHTSAVGCASADRVDIVESRTGRWPQVRMLPLGDELPVLSSSAGRMMLAGRDRRAVEELLPRLTGGDRVRLFEELQRIRDQRYSVVVGAVFTAQASISVPVPGPPSHEQIILTLILPRRAGAPERHLPDLRMAAAAISVGLSRRPAERPATAVRA